MTPARTLRSGGQRHMAPRGQRGAATLVVVMLLFFVVSLTAAYTARNLIFEQRTSANQYRGSQSNEAAEAGLDWATAMLNSGRIDDSCVPTVVPAQPTFRQRYLQITADTGMVVAPARTAPASTPDRWAACMFDGVAWQCSCPGDGALVAPVVPSGQGPFPSFGVRFRSDNFIGARSGVVRIEINGCNSFDLDCLTRIKLGPNPDQCRGMLCGLMALQQGLRAIPSAAVTARGPLRGTALQVANVDSVSGGITVHTGATSPLASTPALTLQGPSGTPPDSTRFENDGQLSGLNAYTDTCDLCLFTSVFGLRPATYFEQPAVLTVDCSTACNANTINALIAKHPDRPLRLEGGGGLALAGAGEVIGSSGSPVVLVVDGRLAMSGGARIFGLVYAERAELGASQIEGALVSSTFVEGTSPAAAIAYDRVGLVRLQNTTGSFVLVPGSWRDFP